MQEKKDLFETVAILYKTWKILILLQYSSSSNFSILIINKITVVENILLPRTFCIMSFAMGSYLQKDIICLK